MMGEIGKAVGQWIIQNVGWTVIIILFLLSCFFKIAKKEIDPLGWVIGLIGKPLTKEVRKDIKDMKADSDKKIADLRSDLDSFESSTNKAMTEIQKSSKQNCATVQKRMAMMEKSNDLQTIRQIKAHILDFANSCLNGRKHTKKDFENIIEENQDYERLCKKHKQKNNKYKEDYDYIMKVYHQCLDDNSFLKDHEAEES